ncbi:MAG: outer membrane beta-barrel protein, partial [Bdellovibrio sp.]|nr:outer membrane beta-barrel protein [Bdellovibrio sp.]
AESKYEEKSLFTIEPIGGYLSSGFTEIKTPGTPKRREGYVVGANVLYGRGNWQLETGLQYAERGMLVNNLGSYNYEYTVKYLEVPAMLRWSFVNRQSWSLFSEAGLVLATVQDAKLQATGPYSESADVKDNFNSLDTRMALSFGGTWKYTKNIAAVMMVNYQSSISPMNKGNNWNGQDAYNDGYAVTVGGQFGI